MAKRDPIPTRVVPRVRPTDRTPREVARGFRRELDAGLTLRPAGEGRHDPERLLRRYRPRHELVLFDTRFLVSDVRQDEYVRFFVAYVVQGRSAWPRLLYKDVSLVWRAASHLTTLGGDRWIGKGAIKPVVVDGETIEASDESTTDLPLELQDALEGLIRGVDRIPTDLAALDLVLRRGPEGRIDPYRDFTAPRERAFADRRNRIHGGRPIARFTRSGDPTSLRFQPGFEPDFRGGVLERGQGTSRLYGGRLRRFRILSRNRKVQYLFFAGPRHAWIIPPQATTTELSSYGVRTVDVEIPEDLCVPGYEYHFMDENEDPPVLFSQIPAGFAGPPSEVDDSRADASAWLDRMPVIREFRRRVL